jgi:hypothetical protein
VGLHDRLSGDGSAAALQVVQGSGGSGPKVHTPVPADPYGDLKARVHHQCIAKLGPELFKKDGDALVDVVYRAVTEELAIDRTPLTRDERRDIVRQLTDDILGYGPIEPLLRDDSVTEIMVNAYDRVYVERGGRLEATDVRFVDESHVLRIIDKIVSQVGRRVDEASPMVDARLPDGSRVNAIIPPLALNGPTLTIRKFARDPYGINELISFGTLTARSAQFLAACVRGKLNVLISGGTGTGKTTTLNALSAFVPNDERIVTIEDAASGVVVPNSIRSSIVYGSRENFRIVSVGPRSESGGMIAFTRLPSGSRASTIGEASSTRRPICETILSMIRSRCALSTKVASATSILPLRST